jgi:hypothetical protein
VLAVHGRKEANAAGPDTLLPASSYSGQEVATAAAELQKKVGGATVCSLLLAEKYTGCTPNWCVRVLNPTTNHCACWLVPGKGFNLTISITSVQMHPVAS